jgi:hypothetical protein
MKLRKYFILLFAGICLSFQALSALTIGKVGTHYTANGIKWTTVEYNNNDNGFKASFPGRVKSGISKGNIFIRGEYQEVTYEVHCSINGRYNPPKKESEFIASFEEAFADTAVVSSTSSHDKVLYTVDLYFIEESKVARIMCSYNQLYWAIVEGEDFSLVPHYFDFFEGIEIIK